MTRQRRSQTIPTIAALVIVTAMNAQVGFAQQPGGIADSAQILNRSGKWSQAFDLASRQLAASGNTREEICELHFARTYAAIRLARKADAVAALEPAKAACSNTVAWAENGLRDVEAELMSMPDPRPLPPVESVLIHPIHQAPYYCTEHRQSDMILGDRFGADCMLAHRDELPDRSVTPMTFFRGNGARNEDWYGWGVPVLAPFDGVVESVVINSVENRVGQIGNGPASAIVFLRADSVRVLYAHLGSITVKQGASVRAGEPVGTVGNNGRSYSPHTHVGAWKGMAALQVRFDLRRE